MPPNTFTLTEYPNNQFIENIWTHPAIWFAQREEVKNYCNSYKEDGINIEYIKYYNYGRYFVKDHKVRSSTIMWSPIRSCLFGETDYDVDIVNCHSNLLLDICKTNDMYDIECLKQYCENRESVIDMFNIPEENIENYNKLPKNKNKKFTKKDIVKNLITRYLYGGSFQEWKKEFLLDNVELPEFVKKFSEEIKLNTLIFGNDKRFKDIIDYEKKRRLEKQKKKRGKDFDIEKFNIKHSKYLSVILQEYETLIIMKVINYVKSKDINVTSYNYDGFQILKNDVSDCEKFVDSLNNDIDFSLSHNDNHFIKFDNIKFIIKPFKDPLDTNELIDFNTDNFEEEVFNKIEEKDYITKKMYFEKYFAKIKSPTQFVEMKKNDYHLFKKKDFMDAYEHLRFEKWVKKGKNGADSDYEEVSFLNEWAKDKTMRYFDNVDYYPTASMCPKKTFNLWNDFPIKNIPLDENANTDLLYYHINTLLNNDTIDIEWFLNWMAHIVQFPHKKTEVCVILYDKKFGTGKSILAEEFLQRIIGLNKMTITAKTDKLFGKFTDTQGKLLYVLNEAKGKDTFELNDIIKDAITGKVGQMEKKGVDSMQVKDYINYIITTNNLNSIKLEEGDRRFMVFKTNGELKGNVQYFTELIKTLEDEVIMRKFYEDLMNRDLREFDASRDRQQNELMDIMKEHNQDFILEFINYWKQESEDSDSLYKKKMKSMELYCEFKRYYEQCGNNITSRPSLTSFGTKLKTYNEYITYKKENTGLFYSLV